MAKIKRHGLSALIEHWGIALSTFLLLFSGFGQMPMYPRYGLTSLPGMSWAGDFSIQLWLHYIGAAGLITIGIYHLTLMLLTKNFDIVPKKGDLKESYQIIKAILTKGEEPPSDKYLAEQRIAYAFIGFSLMLVTVTGILKVIKNFHGVTFSPASLQLIAMLHNLGTFLVLFGFIGHMAAFIVKENRNLLPGIFTGWIDEEYAKHRHIKWYNRVKKSS